MDVWLTRDGDGFKFHRYPYHGGTRLRVVDEKEEQLAELGAFEGTIYVPVRVDESAGNTNPYVKVTKEAVKDLVERKSALWFLNPLCGGKDALLEPLFVAEVGASRTYPRNGD